MDQKTFFEYWATPGKYVAQPDAPLLSSYNQAPAIGDPYPYGISCRQIAYTVLVHWEAASVTEFRTFQEMLCLMNSKEVTDGNIWDGDEKTGWDGLHQLTLDTCLEVLTEPELDTLFTQPVDPGSSYQASPAPPNPDPWWEQLANDLRKGDLSVYKIAVIIRFFDLSRDEIATRLQIPQKDIGRLQSEAQQGILTYSQRWSENEYERIQNSMDRVSERVNRIDLPQEEPI